MAWPACTPRSEHEVGGVPRLLDDETIGQVSQLQVWGRELTQTEPLHTGFAVIFQKPSDHHPWGSYQAFGHDGLGGSLAYDDPFNDVAFAYTVARDSAPRGSRQSSHCAQPVRASLRHRSRPLIALPAAPAPQPRLPVRHIGRAP